MKKVHRMKRYAMTIVEAVETLGRTLVGKARRAGWDGQKFWLIVSPQKDIKTSEEWIEVKLAAATSGIGDHIEAMIPARYDAYDVRAVRKIFYGGIKAL